MIHKKEYLNIIEKINHRSLDSLIAAFEKVADIIEIALKEREANDAFIDEMIIKTDEIRNEAEQLLKKEKENILKEAKKFGLTLSEPDGELVFDPNMKYDKFIK